MWQLLLRLKLSTDVCNIDMGTQIRMGKIVFQSFSTRSEMNCFPVCVLAYLYPVLEDSGELSSPISIFRGRLGGLSTSPQEWSGDIELDGNGGFYEIYSSSDDKSDWLRVHHFNMSSEIHDFLPDL